MIKPGKIRIIDKKILFEPDGLEKPVLGTKFWNYAESMEQYEASKQLISVSNKMYPVWKDVFIDIHKGLAVFVGSKITDNQKCKAEVGETATIVELMK